MIDIGFWEFGLIVVVALLVIGPKRLPGVAQTLGLYLTKLKHGWQQLSDVTEESTNQKTKTEDQESKP